jgi:hypothetical protein
MNEKSIELEKKLEELGFSDWENFGYWLLESTLDYIDYWAWNISPVSPLESYSSYDNIDLYEAAVSFADKLSDEAIELLEKMPEKIYNEINAEYHRKLEIAIEELTKFYGETKIEE